MNEKSTHHLVSPTAKLVAYMRAKSDIPYSAEIADLTDAADITKTMFAMHDMESWMGSMMELRYKSLSALIKQEALDKGITNILELAAGVLPRGIITTEDSRVHYLETDLPDMIAEKEKMVSELGVPMEKRHLGFKPLNVLDAKAMQEAAASFPAGPICIINEGLLQYLTAEEKGIAADNIAGVLKERGGVWITPDVSAPSHMKDLVGKHPRILETLKKLNDLTKRDMMANEIGGHDETIAFYGKHGFDITEYNERSLVSELSVLKQAALTPEEQGMMEMFFKDILIWVFRLKK